MKILKPKNVAALVFAGAMSIGSASAMGIADGTMQLSHVNGVSSTDISVTIKDGIATLFGEVDSGVESVLAANYVSGLEGVEEVINLIIVN